MNRQQNERNRVGKRPAEQWYSGDWFRAVDVRKCSWAVRGIWREMLDSKWARDPATKSRALELAETFKKGE